MMYGSPVVMQRTSGPNLSGIKTLLLQTLCGVKGLQALGCQGLLDSSVMALSCGVCKLGPSGGTALGVKVRSSATPTCPWFLIVDRNIKRQLEPDGMRPAGVRNFKYFAIQVYETPWALSTTLFIRSYTYGNITWCYLVILVLWFFLCHRAKRTSCTIARETAGHLSDCLKRFSAILYEDAGQCWIYRCALIDPTSPKQSFWDFNGTLYHWCLGFKRISLAPKQLLGGRGRKREPGCWCYPLDQPIGSLRQIFRPSCGGWM